MAKDHFLDQNNLPKHIAIIMEMVGGQNKKINLEFLATEMA